MLAVALLFAVSQASNAPHCQPVGGLWLVETKKVGRLIDRKGSEVVVVEAYRLQTPKTPPIEYGIKISVFGTTGGGTVCLEGAEWSQLREACGKMLATAQSWGDRPEDTEREVSFSLERGIRVTASQGGAGVTFSISVSETGAGWQPLDHEGFALLTKILTADPWRHSQ